MHAVDEVLNALRELPASPDEAQARRLVEALMEHAPGLNPLLIRDPSLAVGVLQRPLERDADVETMTSDLVAAARGLGDGPELRSVLRRHRHQEVLRIAAREILGVADIDQTSREMAWLASASIEAALREITRVFEERHGLPRTEDGEAIPQVVLGMGKLGGGELNLGSDIDICFFYGTDDGEVGHEDGQEEGKDQVSVHEHFAKIATRTTSALGDVTGDGFVFRVDLRLRPEGTRGPITNSLAGAERYYETYGRTWERSALLRARPVAGDPGFGDELITALRPFIYRRAVDPSIADAMSEMLVRTRREHRVDEGDVKLGRGGIREAEFFVQALQLIWGGQHPALQVAGTVEGAQRLLAEGLLTERERNDLEAAWALLRRVEHRIHMRAAYQTHQVPKDLTERQGFALSLGFADREAFDAALAAARDEVAGLFDSLTEGAPEAEGAFVALAERVGAATSAEDLRGEVERLFPSADPDEIAAHLIRLARRPESPLGPLAQKERPTLGPMLLSEVADCAAPPQALRFVADLFGRLGPASGLSRVLEADPRLTRRLVGLFGASSNLSETLVRRPELVHELLLRRGPPDASEIAAAHGAPPLRWLADLPDREAFIGALRGARASLELAIGMVTIAGELEQRDAEGLLSATAEEQIAAAMRYATDVEHRRHGVPVEEGHGLVVVGLGKLGGRELGFGGDLDLIFVYAGTGDTVRADGKEGISVGELYTRIAQRTLRLLEEPSAHGRGYEIDSRLRPSGAQGMLVVSLDAFDRYQRERAAVWERQALIRARPIAGDATVAERVQELRVQHAFSRGTPDPVEVSAMRKRMEVELAAERTGRYHPKLGYGGLVDVEFTVQWLQMRHGDDPTVRLPNTHAALAALRDGGYLQPEDAAVLEEARAFLRGIAQALALLDDHAEGVIFEGGRHADLIARRLRIRDRDGARADEVLFRTWRHHAEGAREVFERVIAPVGTRPPWRPQ